MKEENQQKSSINHGDINKGVTLSILNVSYHIIAKKKPKYLLQNASAIILPGDLVALMGVRNFFKLFFN